AIGITAMGLANVAVVAVTVESVAAGSRVPILARVAPLVRVAVRIPAATVDHRIHAQHARVVVCATLRGVASGLWLEESLDWRPGERAAARGGEGDGKDGDATHGRLPAPGLALG